MSGLVFYQDHGFRADEWLRGIEVRGIMREMDLTKVPEFSSPGAIAESLKKMKDRGLVFVDLGSSCALHFPKGEERTKNLDEGKRFIDLAAEIELPLYACLSQTSCRRTGTGRNH